jgi:LacI family transcriptional regulator/LacI family fructose operon transcriptional repressor
VSIRQLAKLTGFSVATVSKALRHDSKVSSATRDLVQQAARKIDYSPNPYVGQVMSSMRRRNTANFRGNIALVFKDSSLPLAADIRHKQIIKDVRERAEELGYQIE